MAFKAFSKLTPLLCEISLDYTGFLRLLLVNQNYLLFVDC